MRPREAFVGETGPLAAQPEHPGTHQSAGAAPAWVRHVWAPISTADPMHLHLYNGSGREWLQNYIFTAPAFLFWVPGVEPGTSYMRGKHSATILCVQFSISTHLLGTGVSYVDQVSLELDPPPSDLWVAGISSLCHQVWVYIATPPKFIIGKVTKMKMSIRY